MKSSGENMYRNRAETIIEIAEEMLNQSALLMCAVHHALAEIIEMPDDANIKDLKNKAKTLLFESQPRF